MDTRLAALRAAANPAVGGRLAAFRAAVAGLAAVPPAPRTLAVVGLVPGAGRSTVTAVLALAVAAYSGRRVVVLDTVTPATGPRGEPGRPPAGDDVAARTVTALLGGDVLRGKLAQLVETGAPAAPFAAPSLGADGPAPFAAPGFGTGGPAPFAAPGFGTGGPAPFAARRQIRAACTPDTAVPVLSLPPGPAGFPPQLLERTLELLAYRADLVLIDTPVGPRAPVLHSVLDVADHYLLIARADQDTARQERAGRLWLSQAAGPPRRRTSTLVVVSRGLRAPRVTKVPGGPGGAVVLGRDEALRRRQPGQLSRSSMITALRLAAHALAAEPSGAPVTAGAVPAPDTPGAARERAGSR